MDFLKHELKIRKNKQKNKFVEGYELQSLMNEIDLQMTLKSLGVQTKRTRSGVLVGYCPDHYLYCGRTPDKPKCYFFDNGKTFCQTERRTSNIVSIAKNLLGLKTQRQALQKLLNGKQLVVVNVPKFAKQKKSENNQQKQKQKGKTLQKIKQIISQKSMPQKFLEYFKRDGITRQTLQKFNIYACEQGFYKNRAIIPFYDEHHQIIGFNAVDYVGKEEWIKQNIKKFICINGQSNLTDQVISQIQKRYKKVMFCPGFSSGNHLFGYYENKQYQKGIDYLVLVQGQRDCLKLMQQGIPCVALHGVNLSKEQSLMIEKISNKEVFLGFDMDQAGNRGCESAYKELNDKIDQIYVLNFSQGKDPKKFISSELLSFIDESRSNKIRSRNNVAISSNVV